MMKNNDLKQKPDQQDIPEIFRKHLGTWAGTALKVSPEGKLERTFNGVFAISIEGNKYHQENTYTLPDGNTRTLKFEGHFEQGVLILNSSSYPEFTATAWDGGNDTIIFRSSKIENDKRYMSVETMTLINSNSRVRSSQIFREGVFDGITYIEETRQEK